MKLAAQIKLLPSPEQGNALRKARVAAVNISAKAVVNQPMVMGQAFRGLSASSQAIHF
jgi:hypothetical protein